MNKAELFKIFYETDKAEAIKFIKEAFSIETPVINVFRTPKEAFNLEEPQTQEVKFPEIEPKKVPEDFSILTTPVLKRNLKPVYIDVRHETFEDEASFFKFMDRIYRDKYRKLYECVCTLDQFSEFKDYLDYDHQNGRFLLNDRATVTFRAVPNE